MVSMKRVPAILTALVLPFCLAGEVIADTVHLKSGARVEGRVLEDAEDAVRIEVDTDDGKSVISVRKDRVRHIETEASRQDRLTNAQGHLDEGEFTDAEAAFRELLRADPADPAARLGLAKALVGLYREAESVKTLEHYRELTGEINPDIALYLAERYMVAGAYRDARALAREVAAANRDDEALQDRVDEFLDRLERVRRGIEAASEHRAQAEAEVERRVEERRQWDESKGDSHESVETGRELVDWANGNQAGLVKGRYLELEADTRHWRTYHSGGDREDLWREVHDVKMKLVVDRGKWVELFDHQKRVILYGWYYQLREVYPNGDPVVTVVAEGGDEERLARASWDGRRDQVVVDRWTQENRDPSRPRPPRRTK